MPSAYRLLMDDNERAGVLPENIWLYQQTMLVQY